MTEFTSRNEFELYSPISCFHSFEEPGCKLRARLFREGFAACKLLPGDSAQS